MEKIAISILAIIALAVLSVTTMSMTRTDLPTPVPEYHVELTVMNGFVVTPREVK